MTFQKLEILPINFWLILESEIGQRKTSAQITSLYSKEELIGIQVIAVVNFPKKQIANFMSECLVLGAVEGKNVTLLKPGKKVQNGLRIL